MPINTAYGYFKILGSTLLSPFSTPPTPLYQKYIKTSPLPQKKVPQKTPSSTKSTKLAPLHPKYTKTSPLHIKSISKDPFLKGGGEAGG